MLPEVASGHLGVAVDLLPLEAFHPEITGALNPTGDFRRTFRLAPVGQVAVADRQDLGEDVDLVEKRSLGQGAVAQCIGAVQIPLSLVHVMTVVVYEELEFSYGGSFCPFGHLLPAAYDRLMRSVTARRGESVG